jgi:hypothetical protein
VGYYGPVGILDFKVSDLSDQEEQVLMIPTLIWLAGVVLDIFAISDVMRSNRDMTTKIVIIVLILLLPIIGAGVYLLAFRDKGY